MGQMEGRVVLVTGAARGQGRSHALRLAREGADIIAIDICSDIESVPYPMGTSQELEETVALVEKLGRRCVSFAADARDAALVQQVVDAGVAELGRLDTVLVNHGINLPHDVETENAVAKWDTVIGVNFSSYWYVVAACVPHMRENGGAIVLTGSAAGHIAVYGNAAYASAKHGLIGLAKSLALDLAKYAIRVNVVSPGTVYTPLTFNQHNLEIFKPGDPDATYEDMNQILTALNALPVPYVEAEVISEAILFFVADSGKYITGTALPVDAGFTIQQPGMTPFLGQMFYELEHRADQA